MRMTLLLRQLLRLLRAARAASEGCAVCGGFVGPHDAVCEEAGCQMAALEAQALMAPALRAQNGVTRRVAYQPAVAVRAEAAWPAAPRGAPGIFC